MAKFEKILRVTFDEAISIIDEGLRRGSVSLTLEDGSEFSGEGARCTVSVYERYSYMGGNRVSLTVTLFQAANGPVHLSAITSGGSQAVFFKINTVGEENFLAKLEEIVRDI